MKRFEEMLKKPYAHKSPVAAKRAHDPIKTPSEQEENGSDITDAGSEPGTADASDTVDGSRSSAPDPARTREAMDALKHKIDKVKMDIQKEQVNKEEHVKDYLDLSTRADNEESIARLKIVFEKKNQASAHSIAKLQKKLERYHADLRRVEQHGATGHRAAKEVLKDVGQGLKDFGGSVVGNIRGATDVFVTKPRDIAVYGKSRSGSADNINSLTRGEGHSTFYTGFLDSASTNGHRRVDVDGSPHSPTGSTTLPANFKIHVPSGVEPEGPATAADVASASDGSYHQARDSPIVSSYNPDTIHPALEPLLQKLNSNADCMDRLAQQVELLRTQLSEIQEEVISLRACMDEERLADRYDRLEEHLNDFVELTQTELTNLKQENANMEEKIDYQLEERSRDLQEALENANTRITKIELQNQHQQLISMEGVDNANAKVLLTKLINVLLAFLAVILVFISTVSNILAAFLNSKWKVASTGVIIVAILLTSSRWELIIQILQEHSLLPGKT